MKRDTHVGEQDQSFLLEGKLGRRRRRPLPSCIGMSGGSFTIMSSIFLQCQKFGGIILVKMGIIKDLHTIDFNVL